MLTVIKPYENIKFHTCNEIRPANLIDENEYKFFCDTDEAEIIPHESKKIQHIDIPIDTEDVRPFTIVRPSPIMVRPSTESDSGKLKPPIKPIIAKKKHKDDYFNNKEIITSNGMNMRTWVRYENRIKTIDEGINRFNNFNIQNLNLAIKNTALFKIYNFDDIDIKSLSVIEVMNNLEAYKDNLEPYNEIHLIVDDYINIVFKDISCYKNDDCPYEMMHAKAVITFTYYECSNCGKIMLNKPCHTGMCECIGIKLYDDEDKIKIALHMKHVINLKGKAFKAFYRDMLIFKKDTFLMYEIENFDMRGISYFKKNFPSRISNITYLSRASIDTNNDAIFMNVVLNYIKDNYPDLYNYTEKDYSKYYNKSLTSNSSFYMHDSYTILYVKNKLNINNTSLALYIIDARKYDRNLITRLKGKSENEIMKYLHLNNKLIMPLIKNNKVGDYINTLRITTNRGYVNTLLKARYGIYAIDKKQIKLLKKNKKVTDAWLVKGIMKYSVQILDDILEMYYNIMKLNKNYELKIQKDMKETHDLLSKDYNRLKRENTPIDANEDLNKAFAEVKFSDIKYHMPKDTYELVDIGNRMGICVGSYGQKAVQKDCYIVAGYDSEGIPQTCIELQRSKSHWKLIQVKKKRNTPPDKNERKAIVNMCNNHEINTKDCIDFNR